MKKSDLFKLSRIMDKIGIRDIKGETDREFGLSMITTVISNIWKAEDEVDTFLASYLEKTKNEIKEMDGNDYLNAVENALKDKDLVSFLKRVLPTQK